MSSLSIAFIIILAYKLMSTLVGVNKRDKELSLALPKSYEEK